MWSSARFRKLVLLGVVTFGVVGSAVYFFADTRPPIGYRTAEIAQGQIVSIVDASGTLKPQALVSISAQSTGQIADVPVNLNASVKTGDVLARLDSGTAEARLAMAAADLNVARGQVEIAGDQAEQAQRQVDNARATLQGIHADVEHAELARGDANRDLKRKRELLQTGDAAPVESDKARTASGQADAAFASARARENAAQAALAAAEAQVKVAQSGEANAVAIVAAREAALRQARLDLDHTTIRSPIDGIVVESNAVVGQTVSAAAQAAPLFAVANDLHKLDLHANVDEADIGRIIEGQVATFTFDAYPGQVFTGKVAEIRKTPQVLQSVVSYDVIISVVNDDLKLLPGMTADTRIVTGERDDVLMVPNAAFRFRPSAAHERSAVPAAGAESGTPSTATIWRLTHGGHLQALAVRAGLSDGIETEIAGGDVAVGDAIVIGANKGSAPETRDARVGPLKF
ncbi:MAG: efflux RND transporter periplasmic adaptor subunit [Rhodospirillales bacterium]|nr:efflux RND transporter periplasmic adaptor subunit [Rhodospirillales bacterium]